MPVPINTSFNVDEEPIIDRPAERARMLAEGRIDFVATQNGVYGASGSL